MAASRASTRGNGRPCTVCRSNHRAEIDLALVTCLKTRAIAETYGVSEQALRRHRRRHLSPAQRAAIMTASRPDVIDVEALAKSETTSLLANVVMQRARLFVLLDRAVALNDFKTAVAVEGRVKDNLELVAKLRGQLVQHHTVTRANILLTADYTRLRSAVHGALAPYPDARAAVVEALHALELEAARSVMDGKDPAVIEGTAEHVEQAHA